MNQIVEISVSDKKRWNNTVKSINNYDAFYINEYVDAFMREDESNGVPVLLYYENGADRAINVVFKRDVVKDHHFDDKLTPDTYFDLITPYGYGDFIGEITDYATLNDVYSKYCMDNGYVCEFVHFELFNDYYQRYSGETETRTHNVVRNLESPMDEIWMTSIEFIMARWNAVMQRISFTLKKTFFEKLMSMNNAVMFHVRFEEKIISTELVIYRAENCYSHLGGADFEYFYTRANDVLKFEIIKWAKEKGLKNFALGGGYGADNRIFQYKMNRALHGIKDFYIGRKIFDKVAYQQLLRIRSKGNTEMEDRLINTGFFPAYRWKGDWKNSIYATPFMDATTSCRRHRIFKVSKRSEISKTFNMPVISGESRVVA